MKSAPFASKNLAMQEIATAPKKCTHVYCGDCVDNWHGTGRLIVLLVGSMYFLIEDLNYGEGDNLIDNFTVEYPLTHALNCSPVILVYNAISSINPQ
jgi:hypothetical protein